MDYNRYIAPNVSVDAVVFQLLDNELMVLLIKRAREPFEGMWALPGSYNPAGETTIEATTRTLKTKAGVDITKLAHVEQLYSFDTIARDPRGHCISITYMGLGRSVTPKADSDTESPQFFPVGNLPKLTYDHADIISYAHNRLISRISDSNAIFALLPKLFTLSQLQLAYETVIGELLDKRNFRKKFLKFNLISPTKEFYMDGAHRPAQLYRFNKQSLEHLTSSLY